MTAVSVDELREAWRALQAGVFARGTRTPSAAGAWLPDGPTLAVLGCAGGAGASTVALAMASAAGPARVVECRAPRSSGFAAAAAAELGTHGSWQRGSRGPVRVERQATERPSAPDPWPHGLTLVDVDWPTLQATHTHPWLSGLLGHVDAVVLVTRATVPGLRHLQASAALLPATVPRVAAVIGPPVKRWPTPVAAAGLPGGLPWVCVPLDARLSVTGLTPDPLPAALLVAGHQVLTLLGKEPQ